MRPPAAARVPGVKVELDARTLAIRLARWEKTLGLMGDIVVSRGAIADVEAVPEPMRAAMRSGMKAGLRFPWVIYIARSLSLEDAYIVRRNQAGLRFSVDDGGTLKHVLISTPEAPELLKALGARS